ncbi:hypothetical protein RvY_10262 [Ramazzottius varieornatus]|uniref:Uncharacterized protein n=1 Tax=Ramazzottius varieornatus TaxID=947166 RepID=A0A1D1VEB0_RAMVA|nr:hypothetical protein RvY_10262 [Ramazzottius varieornatus]
MIDVNLASIHSVHQLVLDILPEADLDSEVNLAVSKWSLLTTAFYTSDTHKARLIAVSASNSGSWLHALPSSSLGNLLDNNSLRISVGLRLGAKLCRAHKCRFGAIRSARFELQV